MLVRTVSTYRHASSLIPKFGECCATPWRRLRKRLIFGIFSSSLFFSLLPPRRVASADEGCRCEDAKCNTERDAATGNLVNDPTAALLTQLRAAASQHDVVALLRELIGGGELGASAQAVAYNVLASIDTPDAETAPADVWRARVLRGGGRRRRRVRDDRRRR